MKTLLSLAATAFALFLLALYLPAGIAPRTPNAEARTIPEVPSPAAHPHSAAARPPATAKPTPPKGPITLAMEAGDACGVARAFNKVSPNDPANAPSLLASVGADPALQELYAPDGPLFGPADAPLSHFQHPLSRLVFALRLAGLYQMAVESPHDDKRAASLLRELETADPGNAVYPYFLFIVEKRLGADQDALKAIAARAANASRFDSYLPAAQRSLQAARLTDPAHFVAINTFLTQIDAFDYYGSERGLVILDAELGTDYAGAVGKLLQEEGHRASHGTAYYGFSGSEFDTGRRLNGDQGPFAYQVSGDKDEGLSRGSAPWLDPDHCDLAPVEEFIRNLAVNS